MIPYEKLSKKEKRKLDAAKRNTWGSLNPVTRKPAISKAYNRSKARNWKREIHETDSGLFVSTGQIDKIVGIQPTTSGKATQSNLKCPEHFRRSGRGILKGAAFRQRPLSRLLINFLAGTRKLPPEEPEP